VSDRVAKGILREKYDWAKPAERSTSSAPSKKAKQERAAARDEEAKRKATLERVQKAQKAIEAAVVAAVLKAPAGSGSSLGKLVLEEWRMNGPMTPDDKRVPPGKSAEDLVRYLAFSCLQADLEDAHDFDFLAMRVKPLGVDLGKLLDQYAPEQPAAAETEVKAKRASGPLARKKGAAAKAKATKRGK
jgi:hypothetical protein